MSNEKVLCDRCDHKPVCSLREEYMDAQKAVNNVIVHVGDMDGSRACGKKLRDFKWIKLPELQCIHFKEFKPEEKYGCCLVPADSTTVLL